MASNKNSVTSLIYVSIVLYILAMCLPVLQAQGIVFNIIVFASFTCFIMGILSKRTISIYIVVIIALITVFDYLLFKTQWSDYTTLRNKMLLLYEFWFPILIIFELFSNKNIYNHESLKMVLGVFLIVYSISCITTIIGNMNYDIPSRWLATADIEKTLAYKYRNENIGGFGFCYLSLFVTPLLIYLYKQTKKKIIVIPLVLSYICAFFSQYFILIFILAIITVLVFLNEMTVGKRTVFIIGMVGVSLFIVANIDAIFNWIISATQNQEVLQKRIQDIYYIIKKDSASAFSDLHLRLEVYGKSFRLFLDNPLTGGWFNSNIGGHSEILDLMGSMGLFGVVLLFAILWTIKKGIAPYYFDLDIRNKKKIKLMLINLLMLAFLNPVLSSREIGIAFFITFLCIDNLKYHLS